MTRSLVILALLLAGCATLGYQSSTVSRPRDQVWKELGDFKATIGYAEGYGVAKCEVGAITPVLCQKGKALLDLVKARIASDEAAALAQGKAVDPQAIATTVFPLLVQYATALGLRLAPLAIP